MNVRALIPKDPGDSSSIEKLKLLSFNEIQPIVPDLLEWLQDCNWPVSGSVIGVLSPIIDQITSEILQILRGDDGVWKYWILLNLISKTSNPILLEEISRIALLPTKDENDEEVALIAAEILRGDYR